MLLSLILIGTSAAFRPRLVSLISCLLAIGVLLYYGLTAIYVQLVRRSMEDCRWYCTSSHTWTFEQGCRLHQSSTRWRAFSCSSLGSLKPPCSHPFRALEQSIALMHHLSSAAEIYARREGRGGLVARILHCSSDFESLRAVWALLRQNGGMPSFPIAKSMMIGIALLALMARYVAVLALVLSQVSGTPLFVVESGKIQTRLVQGCSRLLQRGGFWKSRWWILRDAHCNDEESSSVFHWSVLFYLVSNICYFPWYMG